MRNRDYKQFGKDSYYHIFNRGNAKQNIFLDEHDYAFFLSRLKQNLFPEKIQPIRSRPLPAGSFSLISYCLMPNHFHFLLRQNSDIPTSKLLLRICTGYSIYFNKKYKRVGHLFQDQFKQIEIQRNEYLVWLSAYIHQNPTVAGLVRNPIDYRWSSYHEFVERTEDSFCERAIIFDQFRDSNDYRKFVENSISLMKERKDLEHFLLDYS